MSNVYSIRWHTLLNFEHVQKIIWFLRITQRTRRMPNIPVTYISVCERLRAYEHTIAYADAIRCSVTALLI